jgi:plasmid stabilization system protein ParE
MPKIVKWTPMADASFDDNIEYLRREWSAKEVSNFVKQTMETIKIISAFPAGFVQDEAFGFRKAKINIIVSMIYLEKENHIELLYFWNNRKNPKPTF